MTEQFTKYLSVVSMSMVKFIFGPITGTTLGLSIPETISLTVLGMMLTVSLLTFTGRSLRTWLMHKFARNRKLFTKRNRRIVRIWRSYGLWGIALLTPVLFSPVIGTLIAISFGESKMRIFTRMLGAALFWAVVFTAAMHYFGQTLLQLFR